METRYILAIDQSTTATKVMLFDRAGLLINRVNKPHQQIYPQTDFVEHDPLQIWENTLQGIHDVMELAKINDTELAGIAITNQRETAMMWDKSTGKPVSNAVVWQCLRGVPFCEQLKAEGYTETIKAKTGLIIDSYFSASKLRWIMDNVPEAKQVADKGDLLLGTMDSWLIWKFSNGKVHATDFSNASRTMLFNIQNLKWDDELVALCGLASVKFPEVKFSDEVIGNTDPSVVFKQHIPIAGVLGDSHAALFGQHCLSAGMAKATYGTGSSIMMNIGTNFRDSPNGLVTSIGWGANRSITYVFEGNIHCAGDTINWLVNDLQLIGSAEEAEALAKSVPDSNGVYLVPAFVGLGAPHWNHQARACLSGMPRNTKKAHVVRAALESIAYQVADLIYLMGNQSGVLLQELRVDGGPTKNKFLMQFQSDLLQKDVVVSDIEEVSALGATYMAGLATGFWNDIDEIKALRKTKQTYSCQMKIEQIDEEYRSWKKAIERALIV